MNKKNDEPTFLSILKIADLDQDYVREVADHSLTLAGFTLTSISVLVAFYYQDMSRVSSFTIFILFSLFFFFLSFIFAKEASFLGYLLFAEVLQYLGMISMMIYSLFFLWDVSPKIHLIFPVFFLAILAIFIVKGLCDFHSLYKQYKEKL